MSSKVWRLGAAAASATMLSVLNVPIAEADSTFENCVTSGWSVTCAEVWGGGGGGLGRVILIPGPHTDEERAGLSDRDRRWTARCQPSMRYDRYGVARYTYTAVGCEFGRLAD